MRKSMVIGPARILDSGAGARLAAPVTRGSHRQELWYSVTREYAEWLSVNTSDAFALVLLPFAMQEGENLVVEGALSERLFYCLSRYVGPLLKLIMPHTEIVSILPQELSREPVRPSAGAVVTGFTGGVDSFCTLADHYYDKVPETYKLTHLIFNNVGSAGEGGDALFEERYASLRPLADDLGLPLVKVNSNLTQISNFSFQKTHTLRNASAVLTMQKLFSKYFYSSGVPYANCSAAQPPDIAYADPMMVHLLSTESTECIPTGSQYTRIQKMERVAGMEASHEHLDVCASPASAGCCSVCWKCMRAQLTLEILGKLHLYDKAFDSNKYLDARPGQIVHLLSSPNHFDREVAILAEQKGHRFPLKLRLIALLKSIHATNLVPAPLKRFLKHLLLKN